MPLTAARRAPRAPPARLQRGRRERRVQLLEGADPDDRLPATRQQPRQHHLRARDAPRGRDRSQRGEPRGRARVVVRRWERPVRAVVAALDQRAVDPELEVRVLGEVVHGLFAHEAETVVLALDGSAGPRLDVRRRQLEGGVRLDAPGLREKASLLDPPDGMVGDARAAVRRPRRPEPRTRPRSPRSGPSGPRRAPSRRRSRRHRAAPGPSDSRSTTAADNPSTPPASTGSIPTLVAITSSSRSPELAASHRPSTDSLWPPWPVGDVQNE